MSTDKEPELTSREKKLLRKLESKDVEILSLKSEKNVMNMRLQQLESAAFEGVEPKDPVWLIESEQPEDDEQFFYLQLQENGECQLCGRHVSEIKPSFDEHLTKFHRVRRRKYLLIEQESEQDSEQDFG